MGCISNLTFDGILLDFSKFEELERVGDLEPGCSQKRNDCHNNPCHHTAICEPAWDGHHCRCKQIAHTNGPCTDDGRNFENKIVYHFKFANWISSHSQFHFEIQENVCNYHVYDKFHLDNFRDILPCFSISGKHCISPILEDSFVSLYDEESFAFWDLPENMKFHNLSFEFRTRSRETQVIAVEFSKRSQFIIFSV